MAADKLLSNGSIPMDTSFVTTNNLDIATKKYVDNTCTAPSNKIVGRVIMWPFDIPPIGYLLCDGSTYNYNDYPDLGVLLGGSSGGTFTTPDINFTKNSKGTDTLLQESQSVGSHGHTSNSHGHTASISNTGAHYHLIHAGEQDFSAITAIESSIYTGTTTTHSGGSHTHTAGTNSVSVGINNYTGTNQPACTLINFCIKY